MTSGSNNFNYFPENQLTKSSAVYTIMPNGDQMAIGSAIWPLKYANISYQLPKLYLSDSLNRMTCGADIHRRNVRGVRGARGTVPPLFGHMTEKNNSDFPSRKPL